METARGGDLVRVLVTNVDRLVNCAVVPMYRRSVEQELLDWAVQDEEYVSEMITSLGLVRGASGEVKKAITANGGYRVPIDAMSNKIREVVANTLLGGNSNVEMRVIGVVRGPYVAMAEDSNRKGGEDEVYALVVPVEKGTGNVYGKPYIVSSGMRVTEAGARHVGAAVVVMRQPISDTVVYVYFVTQDFGSDTDVPVGVIFKSRAGRYTGTVWTMTNSRYSVMDEHEELSELVTLFVKRNGDERGGVRLNGHAIRGAVTRIGSYQGATGGGMYTMMSIWESGKESVEYVRSGDGRGVTYDEEDVREMRQKLTYLDVAEGDVFRDVVYEDNELGWRCVPTGLVTEVEKEKTVVRVESARGVRLVERELASVKVGGQVWTAENLDVGEYGDGGEIEEAQSAEEWEAAYERKVGAWCYHPENAGNGQKWGKLYNVCALERVSPRGWRVPTDADWVELIKEGCGGDVKKLIEGEFKACFPVGFRVGVESGFSDVQTTLISGWFCGLDTKKGRVSLKVLVGGKMVSENNAIDYYRNVRAGLAVRLIKEGSVL